MAMSSASWNGDAGRYTPEQWARACLIHMGDPSSTNKGDHKLPVREPGGAINKAGMHAAAAALAGARGGVNAPPEKKRAAARKLMSMYREAGETPPPSLVQMAKA